MLEHLDARLLKKLTRTFSISLHGQFADVYQSAVQWQWECDILSLQRLASVGTIPLVGVFLT